MTSQILIMSAGSEKMLRMVCGTLRRVSRLSTSCTCISEVGKMPNMRSRLFGMHLNSPAGV